MKIKFPIRYTLMKNDKDSIEDRKVKRLIGKEDDEGSIEDFIKYEYRSFVCESSDIKTFVEYDEEHTTIGLPGGDFYVVKAKFGVFEAFYNFINGVEIKDIESFNFANK